MSKYQVRSRELLDVTNDINNRRLVISPFFQRNLVWRLIHKIDFIKTILLGFPFPQIFIAKGKIDLENMTTTSCIVDGQQRMNSIREYLKDDFEVDGRFFSNLGISEKQQFLKYEIPIIDLDLDSEDPEIIEIFQRLNRTFYALSGIEKLSTEFASSEFMLFAKFIVNEIDFEKTKEDYPLQLDPNIPESFILRTKNKKVKHFSKLMLEESIFSSYELTRQTHLNFALNIMSTYIHGFYNRNDLINDSLDQYANEFAEKDSLFEILELVAEKFLKLKFTKKSIWLNKANAFSLITLFAKEWLSISEIGNLILKEKLTNFESNMNEEYRMSAKEGVNNKKERLIRNKQLEDLLLK